jgi:uncharacterized protein Yka (UPF0111/DUF47 family)
VTTRIIRDSSDIDALAHLLRARKLPFTVSIASGKARSSDQNRLQRLWCQEIAEQLGDRTAEHVRGEMKLRFGVPILRHELPEFAEKYDRLIKPRPYAEKLEMMMEPLDFPITRLMTVDQLSRYLDACAAFYGAQGIRLTMPEAA